MPWYSKEVGDGVAALGPKTAVTDAFARLALSGATSRDSAVFSRYDIPKNMETLYFSPTADVMANLLNATPCPKPSPDADLSLLVGDAFSWDIHFPGHRPGKHK